MPSYAPLGDTSASIPSKRRPVAWRRCFCVIATCILASVPLAISETALAQACTVDGSGNITCPAGTYTSNIEYSDHPSLTLSSGPSATSPGVTVNSPGGNAVGLSNSSPGASATLTATNATINNTVGGSNNAGLAASASAGNVTITSLGAINVSGGNGIDAFVVGNGDPNAVSSVIYNGPGLSSSGAFSTGIQANNLAANGTTSIDASGNISGFVPAGPGSQRFSGLFAEEQGNGNTFVYYRSGTINVQGNFANGIFAGADGAGSAQVITYPGTTIIVSGTDPGASNPTEPVKPAIDAESGAGTAAGGQTVTENVASTIMTSGTATPDPGIFNNPVAIRALSHLDAPISVTYTGPGITTQGGGGIGILALSSSGGITVNSSGPITTNGSGALGILADSGNILNAIAGSRGDLLATALGASPLLGAGGSPSTGGPVTVVTSAPITTRGAESDAIWATSTTGPVQVTVSTLSATGEFSAGINANGGSTTVNVSPGGSVMGGWQATPNTVGPTFGLPAAGVILGASGGTATLTNDGSIGALSDLAIKGEPQVVNNADGTITGFVQFAGGNNSILNNGTFNLRDFADTTGNMDSNGNGVRDTVRVAVADLGTGPNNTFTNNGILALVQVTGATTLDSTGQYLPLGNASNAMALGGPLQGQLIGVATFTNSGTIDLQADPVPGDVLLITGGRQPGIAGPGTFISNGGSLKLDTVLNQGGAATLSDTLVVDGTSAGPGGATKTFIHNAGGTGAETSADGILVVQVLDPSRSDPGAFVLGGETRAGAFDYDLFHGGLNGSNPGDWFLRSTFIVPPPPTEGTPPLPVIPAPPFPVDPPPQPLPPGIYPIIGPELATDGVVQPIARQMGLTMLGTLHERVGDTLTIENADPDAAGWGRSGWARFFGQQIDNQYQSFADPSVNGRLFGVQAGFDILRASFIPGHRDAAGVYFAYGNSAMDVNGLVTNAAGTAYIQTRTGTVDLYAYSGGAYWTHYGPGGWYFDAVVQGTAYTGNATTQFANLPTNGSGILTSLEGGYPFVLASGPRFILEPQGQIIWQHTSFSQANDGLGPVALGTTSGVTGRLGLRAQSTINAANGQVWQPYVRANLWQNWGGSATTTFGVDQVPLLQESTQLEFAAGLTTKVNDCLSFYVQAGYEFAVGGTDGGRRQGVKGDIGLRLTFGHPPPPAVAAPVAAPAPVAAHSYLVFFDWDKATLTDRAKQIIREAADNSTHVQYTRIEVNGYTDTSGSPRYNQGLSLRRAQSVAGELVRDGVPAGAIGIQGFGETHLLVPTGAGVREPQNRRVEIILD